MQLLRVVVCAITCSFVAATPAEAVEIEGVQPASLDQPRINLSLRRSAKGKPLILKAAEGEGGNIQAFLDTGASGVVLSEQTANALQIQHAAQGRREITFHDIGVGGTEVFAVSEPLFLALGSFGGPGERAQYNTQIGPIRTQIKGDGGGLLGMLTGGLDVVGMPIIKGHIVVLDPRPVDTFGATMITHLLDPRTDRRQVPRTDRTIQLSYVSFARFTRTEPDNAQGPSLESNPMIGPNPVPANDKNPKANAPAVVAGFGKEQSSGTWLLDTGAAASMISTAQAKKLGVTYDEAGDGRLVGPPANEQFSLTIGGIGGQRKAFGFYLDTLTLPTREGDPIVYKRAPVLVADITVIDPATDQTLTLDGVLGMNFFVASANVDMAGGLLPDINQLTPGAYEAVVIDAPAGTLGVKLKPEFLKGNGKQRGSIEIKPRAKKSTQKK
jgi:hypothetical protein